MEASENRFIFNTTMTLVVGAIIVAGLVLSSLYLADRTRTSFANVITERDIRRASVDMLAALRGAETGQRGFLLTGDRDFLEPYENARLHFTDKLATLSESVRDRPIKHDRMEELTKLIQAKVEELKMTVDLAEAGDIAGATAIVKNEQGRVLMEQISDILEFFIARSDINIDQGVDEQLATTDRLRTINIAGALALIILLAATAMTMARHISALTRTRLDLETLNMELETRVAGRTEDLIRANQEVQRYAYIVSHDLRAPLVNIMGFTAELKDALDPLRAYVLAEGNTVAAEDILRAREAVSEDIPEALDFIRSSTRKMDGLINAILKVSRDGRRDLKPERIDIRQLVDNTLKAVQHQILEEGGEVQSDLAVETVVTDRFSVDQILSNLVDNAVKYAHPERPLALTIRSRRDGPSFVRIEVEDNGRGIAEADHERIFDLFRRSGKQDKKGEGIGLAHVRSLARNLGGDITVKSSEGEGSVFLLRLPNRMLGEMQDVRK
ncbi:MAG: CHASE3 domain-containing protein [Notoacmeibacter sp.]|nr:CHASE3 domain-containing protein [Notoacmeibacter sp.]